MKFHSLHSSCVLFAAIFVATHADPETIVIPRRFRHRVSKGTRNLRKNDAAKKKTDQPKNNDCHDGGGRVRKKCSRSFNDGGETIFEGQDGSFFEVNDKLEVHGDVELSDFIAPQTNTAAHEPSQKPIFNDSFQAIEEEVPEDTSNKSIFQVHNGTFDDFNGTTRL